MNACKWTGRFSIWQQMASELRTIVKNDPALKHRIEALLCYPGLRLPPACCRDCFLLADLFFVFLWIGLWALWSHHFAHWLFLLGVPILPRVLMTICRLITGVDIHPGASFGLGTFIDHGAGVVIGETAILGDNCLIYQGATLGGTGKEIGRKRHPTLGNSVVVGAGSKCLGSIKIGDNARIGAGSVVVKDVEPNSTMVGIPARAVTRQKAAGVLDHSLGPDMEARAIRALYDKYKELVHDMNQMEARFSQAVSAASSAAEAPIPAKQLFPDSRSPVFVERHGNGAYSPLNEVEDFIFGAGI